MTSTSRQNSVRCGVPYSRLRAAAVRRDAILRDALLAPPTSNGGAAIVAYVIERPEYLLPTWTRVVRVRPQTTTRSTRSATWPTTDSASASKTSRSARPTAVGSFSRPTADGHGDNQDSTCPFVRSCCVYACSDIFISFQQRTFNASARTSRTLTIEQYLNSAECVYLYYLVLACCAFIVRVVIE